MPRRDCEGTNKRGEPCKAPAMHDSNYCNTHNTDLPAEARFGSPQQAREAATGVQRRYPRLREQIERKLEEKASRIVDAQLEALDATRLTVSEDGEVHVHPDYLTRLRAGDTLVSRALGKPGTMEDHVSEHAIVNVNLVTNEQLRLAAADLRGRLAADRSIEPSRLGAGV